MQAFYAFGAMFKRLGSFIFRSDTADVAHRKDLALSSKPLWPELLLSLAPLLKLPPNLEELPRSIWPKLAWAGSAHTTDLQNPGYITAKPCRTCCIACGFAPSVQRKFSIG